MRIKRDIIIVVLLISLGIIPITWFKQDYINGGDFAFPMAPVRGVVANYADIWLDRVGTGLVNSRAIPQLPLMALISIANDFGISNSLFERLLFSALFLLSEIGIYCVVCRLPFGQDKKRIAAFAAVFYMLNPFNVIFYWHILDGMIFAYAVFPCLLWLYLEWSMRGRFCYLVLFCVTSFFAGYTFSNPLNVLTLWVLLLFFVFTVNGLGEGAHENGTAILKKYSMSVMFWAVLNAWWFLPLLGSIRDEYSGLSATIGTPWDVLAAFSRTTSLLNLMRVGDLYWAFQARILGDPYYSYGLIYRSGFFVVISFLIPVAVFLPLVIRRKNISHPVLVLDLYLAVVCLMFLAKGSHGPFGKTLYSLIFNLPLLPAFRAPIHKLGVLLSMIYAMLFGYGVSSIYLYLNKIGKTGAVVTVFGIIVLVNGVYSFPLLTGDVIQKGGNYYPSFHVKVPEEYQDLNKWMHDNGSGYRFYSLPQSDTLNVTYKWEHGYIGADPGFFLFDRRGVYGTVHKGAQLPYRMLV
ncbi:MAG: hypothetical protein JRJ31_22795, partial [Deltaproteobacteria bacterium]|nr:hypothetical protein [Deltaproteobacteria bacterium]